MRLTFSASFLILLSLAGCMAPPSDLTAGLPAQIGLPAKSDTTGLDAYETAVVGLLDHMSDAFSALSQVENSDTSNQAAQLIDEANPRFIRMRRAMMLAESDREITAAGLILTYGPRYLGVNSGIDREMKRIKSLGPDVHEPVKAALLRLREDLKNAGLPDKP